MNLLSELLFWFGFYLWLFDKTGFLVWYGLFVVVVIFVPFDRTRFGLGWFGLFL